MLQIIIVVAIIVAVGIVVKNIIVNNSQRNLSEVGQMYKFSALVELSQIVFRDGYARPIVQPAFLVEAFQNNEVKITVVSAQRGDNPPNSLWVSTENKGREHAEKLVRDTAQNIIHSAQAKVLEAKNNKHKMYSVIGETRIVKYQMDEPTRNEESINPVFWDTGVTAMVQIALISLLSGVLASFVYLAYDKIGSDYRRKYPT